jgi:hypothetical protein
VSSGNGFVVDLSDLCSTVLCITNVEMALIDGINGHDLSSLRAARGVAISDLDPRDGAFGIELSLDQLMAPLTGSCRERSRGLRYFM